MSGRRFVLLVGALSIMVTTCLPASLWAQAAAWTHPMNAVGKQPHHGYFSAAPWESVDMMSGNAVLTFPGLTLPGYNGIDFQFLAIANLGGDHDGVAWSFDVPGPKEIWNYAEVPDNFLVSTPIIGSADGGLQYTFATPTPYQYLTLTFDRVTQDPVNKEYTLEQPNGVKYSFKQYSCDPGLPCAPPPRAYLLTRKEDQFGNKLVYVRDTYGALVQIEQYVGNRTRVITMSSAADELTVTWSTRVWRYTFDALHRLTGIVPPAGPAWQFDYTAPYTLTVTTPTGGVVGYRSEMQYGPLQPYPPHQPFYHTKRLVERKALSEDGQPTWSFTYQDPGEGGAITGTVTLPTGVTKVYTHDRTPEGGAYGSTIYLAGIDTGEGSTWRENIGYSWHSSGDWGMQIAYSRTVYPEGRLDLAYEEEGAPMLIDAVTIVRDGQTFMTTYQ